MLCVCPFVKKRPRGNRSLGRFVRLADFGARGGRVERVQQNAASFHSRGHRLQSLDLQLRACLVHSADITAAEQEELEAILIMRDRAAGGNSLPWLDRHLLRSFAAYPSLLEGPRR